MGFLGLFHLGLILADVFFHLACSLFGLHSLFFLALAHESANLLGEAVHLGRGRVFFLLSSLTLRIQFEHFFDSLLGSGEMFLLKTGNNAGFVFVDLFECKHLFIDDLTILYSAMPHTIGKAVDDLTIIKKKSLLR